MKKQDASTERLNHEVLHSLVQRSFGGEKEEEENHHQEKSIDPRSMIGENPECIELFELAQGNEDVFDRTEKSHEESTCKSDREDT